MCRRESSCAALSSATQAIMICDVVSTSNKGMAGPFPEMRVSRETVWSGTLGRRNTPLLGMVTFGMRRVKPPPGFLGRLAENRNGFDS